MGWGSIFDIFNKILKTKKRVDFEALKSLQYKYAKALNEGRDTDAAILKKQIDELRWEMENGED